MEAGAYEVLALCMRYVFAALMLLIVLRAARITAADGQRSTKLRRLSPQTGIIGELVVMGSNGRLKNGTSYRVILEGTIGSSRRCDVRIRHSSIRARHAIFQMTNEGLFIRNHASARIADGHGHQQHELMLHDGDLLFIGSVRMMLILSEADDIPEELNRRHLSRHTSEEHDETARNPEKNTPDDLFLTNPAGAQRSSFDLRDTYDEFDESEDDYDEFEDAYDDEGNEYDEDGDDMPDETDEYDIY